MWWNLQASLVLEPCIIGFNSGKRLRFILDLFKAGLLELRASVSSHVGVFFVKKKDPNAIRMVIDCRGTTQLCQDPQLHISVPPGVTRVSDWIGHTRLVEQVLGDVKRTSTIAFTVLVFLNLHTSLGSIPPYCIGMASTRIKV